MNIDMELIQRIAKDLNIGMSSGESQESWMCRVVYSALGHSALVSLWDQEENQEPISIVHFKRRIERNFGAYKLLYPQIASMFSVEEESLTEEIYNCYSETGFFYHSPNRLSAAAFSRAYANEIALLRGLAPGKEAFMSGLGFYQIDGSDSDDKEAVKSMFGLPLQTLKESYDYLLSSVSWSEERSVYRKEYLRIQPPFKRGYWKENPDTDGEISLMRLGEPGGYIYYLYRFQENLCWVSQLPEWLTQGYEYRKVSNWLLAAKGSLPCIEYEENDELVSVKVNYLLPPREQNFLKLYSWPQGFRKLPSDFNRIADKRVFYVIKELLEEIGYVVRGV